MDLAVAYDADTYDYVIVGAGSAGCVLAARLSEDADSRVLLVEAGPLRDHLEVPVPAALALLFRSDQDWGYQTVPQTGLNGRRIYWPRGRGLGGSSAINAMIYLRGNRADYDAWRDECGCVGWGYADLLPYFKRAQDQRRGSSPYHGVGGPLRLEDLRYRHRLSRGWVRSARAYGLPANDDFNGAHQEGVGFYQVTQRRGRRWSVADAYLRPAMKRTNLTVMAEAQAARVLLYGRRAIGVRYWRHGREHHAYARREVILSGGSINSPQLLMLSGIGPVEQLRRLEIDVVIDSPGVGANLRDHPTCAMLWGTPRVRNLWESTSRRNLLRWQILGRGPMTSNLVEAGGFVRTRPDAELPDLRFHVIPVPYVEQGLVQPTTRMVTVLVTALSAASRGRVTLRSADPRWAPAIDPCYLSEEADADVLVAGVRQAREIAATEPFSLLTDGEVAPGAEVTGDAELRAWVRDHVVTLYHPVGTCAMGGDGAVCDPELRVRGVTGLRVVDASVMPTLPRGDTNAPTVAIAERAADLMRDAR